VKVTPSPVVPATGAVVDDVHEKEPDTEAVPPLSVEEARVWPYVIALAVGHADTVGVVLVVPPPPPPEFDPPPHPTITRLTAISKQAVVIRITNFSSGSFRWTADRIF
jgi:hypothetical protein